MTARFFGTLAALVIAAAGAPAQDAGPEGCTVCHGKQGLEVVSSVHAQVGIGCRDCHGGTTGTLDADEAHGDDLKSLADSRAAVASCGDCHSDGEAMRLYGLRTDQLSLYWKSPHGQHLQEGDGDGDGVATCVSCHGAHAIFRASDPRSTVHKANQIDTCGRCHADRDLMERYELSWDVPRLYRESVHGRALLQEEHRASPSCADCHGSHGATPPRVAEVGQVCGSCHAVVREYFEDGPHMSAVLGGRMEECVSCHGSHGVGPATAAMFLGEEEGHCASCHPEGVGTALTVASELFGGLGSLDEAISSTERELDGAAARGLFLEREHGYLDEARGLRVRARPLTHSLSPEALTDLRNRAEGMIQQTIEGLGIKDRGLRDRKIFTGIFLAVVLVFAAVLQVYRRDIFGQAAGPEIDRAGGPKRSTGGGGGAR